MLKKSVIKSFVNYTGKHLCFTYFEERLLYKQVYFKKKKLFETSFKLMWHEIKTWSYLKLLSFFCNLLLYQNIILISK